MRYLLLGYYCFVMMQKRGGFNPREILTVDLYLTCLFLLLTDIILNIN